MLLILVFLSFASVCHLAPPNLNNRDGYFFAIFSVAPDLTNREEILISRIEPNQLAYDNLGAIMAALPLTIIFSSN